MAESGAGAAGAAEAGAAASPKRGRGRLMALGGALMALTGAGAFAAVWMLAPGEDAPGGTTAATAGEAAPAAGAPLGAALVAAPAETVAFVPVEAMTVTLQGGGAGGRASHLRIASQLEVPVGRAEEVARLMPRVVDAMGGYLRALEPEMVADRDAHLRLRAQMLRRVRLVLGPEAVHDLLLTEFMLN